MKKGRLTKVVVTQKGITLDVANACVVNFDTMKHMVLNDEMLQSEPRYQFQWDKKSKTSSQDNFPGASTQPSTPNETSTDTTPHLSGSSVIKYDNA